jgi:pimeloyl-ACP methyl ester carboxylesterase
MARLAFAALAAVALTGCFLTSPTPPMRVMDHAPRGPERAEGLVVFLPGFGDHGGVFDRYGLVDILEAETRFDALGAHAHFGFYRDFSVLPRLERDVIGPARAMGYERIWLVGTSMGGFGAVSYAAAHPAEVKGVILMAPYLGEPAVLEEIRAEGLADWDPGELEGGDDRAWVTRRNWAWIREQLGDPSGTPIYLGYGEQDPGVPEFEMLEELLPEQRVVHLPGPHGWAAWTPVFDRLVDRAFAAETRLAK